MPREKFGYRDVLEDLLAYMDGKRMMSLSEISRYTGLERRSLQRKYGFEPGGTHISVVARKLCGGDGR